MKRLFSTALLLLAATRADAGGFANPDLSGSALGVANAFVATADDPSAVVYNPAGIAWQDGYGVMGGGTLRSRDSSSEVGAAVLPNDGKELDALHLYGTWMPLDGDFGLGVGISQPYLMGNDWGGAFGGQAGRLNLRLYRLSLNGVYAVNSSLAFAAGADWHVARLEARRGATSFRGDDFASFGGHVAMMWKFHPHWSLGAVLRSGAKLDFTGDPNASATLKLPYETTVGLAYDVVDNVRLELDVNWQRWSTIDRLDIRSGGTLLQRYNFSLDDGYGVMAGVTWSWREHTEFRFGYAYERAANSDAGFHAALADQDGHRLSLGASGDLFGVHADVAYAYSFYPDRTVRGVFAGTYRDRRQSLALSLSKRF